MKIAPVYRAMRRRSGIEAHLVHTGQHFDKEMSTDIIEALELPAPEFHLGISGGTQAFQIAEVLRKMEEVLAKTKPDVTVVVGDVNSTLGAALASSTLRIPVAHVEAGLRSRDWTMPEERNRVLTDRLSRFLFTPSPDGDENLRNEGIEDSKIFQVGNVMIDSLDWMLPRLPQGQARRFGVEKGKFGVVTLHRPANVDDEATLKKILGALQRVAEGLPLLFPVHPRTRQRMKDFGLGLRKGQIQELPSLGYPEFVGLLVDAALVLTDSGGIQEEATVLGLPCVTLRENTERPITVQMGMNQIVGSDPEKILAAARAAIDRPRSKGMRPPLWDGKTAERIVDVLVEAEPLG
jgi:UDP-N-acetylglucosamine 2-epimerase (non-hydrolysing)